MTAPPAAEERKIWSLQVLRFVAAALVVIAHGIDSAQALSGSTPWLGRGHLENFGSIGVDLFFVISGFIIARTAFGAKQLSAGAFLRHRLVRVVPIYYLLSLPWIWMAWQAGDLYPSRLVTSLFFWPAMPGRMVEPYLGIGWTLCFEMLFYTCICLAKLGRPVLAAQLLLFLALMLLRGVYNSSLLQFLGNPIILEFLLGVLLALNYPRILRLPPLVLRALMALALAWIAALLVFGFGQVGEAQHTLDATQSLRRAALFGLPSMLVALCFIAWPGRIGGRFTRLLVYWGDASYSMYLIHPLVILAANHAARRGQWQVEANSWLLALLAATLLVSSLIYSVIEKPLTRALRKRLAD